MNDNGLETAVTEALNENRAKRGIRTFTIGDAQDWMEYSGTSLADVLNEDETPGIKLGAVGFARAPAGAASDFDFAYDELLVVTKGRCTIQCEHETVTVDVGEVIYLPAGTPGRFHADEESELVYVASSPYGEINREAKTTLLDGA